MCEMGNDHTYWLNAVTKKITTNLGKNFDDVYYAVSVPDNSFFVSNMLFISITATSSKQNGKEETIEVVVKKPSNSDNVRMIMRSDDQFHNEILFYNKFGKDLEEIPRCVYTEENPPTGSMIALENVMVNRGFKVSECKYDVPMEYTLSACKQMARFHAKTYVMKEQRREQLLDLVKNIHEARYYPGSTMINVINDTATRSVDYLRKKGHDGRLCDKLESQLKDAYNSVILKAIVPEEPLATLCHGDFTINNTLFKRENGEVKAMLIDFALIRYGSPVLDLSTFLCLHCARDLDKNMLDTVLKAYHDTLKECLRENDVDCEQYSYEALYEDFKKKGLFGFFISTFFLAVAMGKGDKTPEEFADMDPEEWGQIMRAAGGDEISEILANMLLRLKDFGCLDHM